MFCPLRTFTHSITPQAVDLEADLIRAAVASGGRPLRDGVDLTQVAANELVEQAMSDLHEANVAVTRRVWDRAPDGGVHLVIELDREADVVHAAIALG